MIIQAEPPTSTLLGVGIAIAGNLLISLALNVQKLAHRRIEDQRSADSSLPERAYDSQPSESSPLLDQPHDLHSPADHESPSTVQPHDRSLSPSSSGSQSYQPNDLTYLSSPLWWLGFILMSTGELGNFVSYGFAPASVVAPLGTVALVGNCVAAPILLGERFKKRDWLGIGLAIIGTITIVFSSPRNSEALSPGQLALAIRQLGFILYATLCLLAILLLIGLSSTRWANRFIGIDVGLCAISGGFTVLSTKAFSSLLNVLFFDCFEYPITWIMLVVMLVTAMLQIIFLNRALQRFDSKHVVPVQFVLFTMMAVVGSTILYGDFRNLGSAQVGNFIFACGFIFTGVYILTRDSPTTGEDQTVPQEHRKLHSTCRNTTLTPVQEEQSIESTSITDLVIQPFAIGTATHVAHLPHSNKLSSPSWNSVQFSLSSPSRRAIRRQQSQPILLPRAFGTPGYYLIASSISRSQGNSHGFPR